jgi:hypothetical protein
MTLQRCAARSVYWAGDDADELRATKHEEHGTAFAAAEMTPRAAQYPSGGTALALTRDLTAPI